MTQSSVGDLAADQTVEYASEGLGRLSMALVRLVNGSVNFATSLEINFKLLCLDRCM